MAIHKLQIDDFFNFDYELIAIHSSLEDYRLAYFINQKLPILLEKSPADIGIQIPEGESHFSRFIFEDNNSEIIWNLIQNKNTVISKQEKKTSLFQEIEMDVVTNVFLLPELKNVDYIFKIENTDDYFGINSLIEHLLSIKHITTAYKIEKNKIKSKNNLIF